LTGFNAGKSKLLHDKVGRILQAILTQSFSHFVRNAFPRYQQWYREKLMGARTFRGF
jgi:hypothetical protein